MRIAVITTSYPAHEEDPSGHFVRAEVRALEQEGHTVVVVAPAPGGAFGWPGVIPRLRADPLRAVLAATWIGRARRRLRREGPFDRIVAHWAVPCAWPIALPMDRAEGPELEVVSHGSDVRLILALPPALRDPLIEAVARRAARWRFVSAPLRDALLGAASPEVARRVRAHVAPAAIEIPDVRAASRQRRIDLGSGGTIAVAVGRLVPEKRVDRVLEHAARVGPRLLVVVGDGPERARLEALAERLGVNARFVGLVGRYDAMTWIGAADVLWHASRAEGLSTVIREAEALGVPVEWI